MWSAAASSVGGRGRAFCVLVEKVDVGRGEVVDVGEVTVDGTGLRARTVEAVDIGRGGCLRGVSAAVWAFTAG